MINSYIYYFKGLAIYKTTRLRKDINYESLLRFDIE